MTALNATSNPAYVALEAFLGVADQAHETAIDFETNNSYVGAANVGQVIEVAANSTVTVTIANTAFANCPVPQFFAAYDVTPAPGLPFGFSLDNTHFMNVAALSFVGWICDGEALPATIYLKNPSMTTAATIKLVCITN